MAGLGPAIHGNLQAPMHLPFVDTRPKAGHDALKEGAVTAATRLPPRRMQHRVRLAVRRQFLTKSTIVAMTPSEIGDFTNNLGGIPNARFEVTCWACLAYA